MNFVRFFEFADVFGSDVFVWRRTVRLALAVAAHGEAWRRTMEITQIIKRSIALRAKYTQ